MTNLSNTCDLLFVYGTLRSGSGHRMADYLAERATLIGTGRAVGRLFDFGVYPGMLPSDCDDEFVIGEVWRLHEFEATMATLDRYEGCVVEEPQPWIFRRAMETIALDDGKSRMAWVYWYCGDESGGKRIASGDYLNPLAG